jgi:2-polyprenyl-3-methyl-5-hydroxy-6-metoxy-1,4-benzoquinol methylase
MAIHQAMPKLSQVLSYPQGTVSISASSSGKIVIAVRLGDNVIGPKTYETKYPKELIQLILNVTGPFYLIDEIQREEDPNYVENRLVKSILAYIPEKKLRGARLLDFGCGGGSSTVILGRSFPESKIVGVDLNEARLEIARARKKYYNFNDRILFSASANSNSLPDKIGMFDFIVLNAVYEHLLPTERSELMCQLWNHLKPGGVMFLNETPYRYYPIEIHTTGLPMINYLPDKVAFAFARKYSKRIRSDHSWSTLLRRGIRGTTEKEVLKNIRKNGKASLLTPSLMGCKDRIDLWYVPKETGLRVTGTAVGFGYAYKIYTSRSLNLLLKILLRCTGVAFVHSISLAIQKSS